MTTARFKVSSDKPDFNKTNKATITISRLGGVFSVRPHRQHKRYTLPLSEVAQMVMWRVIKGEAEVELAAKGTLRMKRRRNRL